MLELRGALAVGRDRRPVVVEHHAVLPTANRDHRLDREGHPGAHNHRRPLVVIVQHLHIGVELFADSVADERAHNTEMMLLRVVLDRTTDVAERTPRNDGLDAVPHALFGHLHKVATGLIDIADQERGIGIAMHATDEGSDIDVDDVAIGQRPTVGDAVANYFVDAGAHALGVLAVVQRARVCPTLDRCFVDEHVDLVGRHARAHHRTCKTQNLGSDGASVAHALDDLGRLHAIFSPALDAPSRCVRRASNVLGNRPHWADNALQDATLKWLMTPLVLAAAATPTRLVRLRQQGRRFGHQHPHSVRLARRR